MDDSRIEQLTWLPELMEQVGVFLNQLTREEHDQRPALEEEIKVLDGNINGWSQSLAKPDLAPELRASIEAQWTDALARKQEIENILAEQACREEQTEQLLSPADVLDRLERLPEVLATNNPTAGNLELSLHIDRIVCSRDGKVQMRTSKLGAMTDAVELLANVGDTTDIKDNQELSTSVGTPRRRGRLRVADIDTSQVDLRALADFAADPDRFADLGDEWFWIDEFQIPGRTPSWAAEHAEAIFLRRQEAKLSYSKLAAEFGVTAPTARAAVQHYLTTNPEAKDDVNLTAGGAKPKIDVARFADEARQLWEDGWSKLKLADKFDCSTPIIDNALSHAYEQDGLPMPTRKSIKLAKIADARKLLDEGYSLDDIADTLNVSDVTARQYLKESFAAEDRPMPDLRCRR